MDAWRNSLIAILALYLGILPSTSSAAPPREASITARLSSCDPAVVHSAADQLLHDPATLEEPLMLFHAATGERMTGRKEEAAFLYLAARLRATRQILFEKGDRPQLLTIMMMTVGPLVMPVLESDPDLARRVVKRVIEWDRATPDPFRDREEAKSGEIQKKLAEIDAGLARLPDQIRDEPGRAARAREAEAMAEQQVKSSYAERCGPGTLDPVDAEAATTRIKDQAENLAKTNPFVLNRAGGAVKSVSVGSWNMQRSGLPKRLTVSVTPASGKSFYAEIDAEVSITPDRKLGSIRTSLACITDLWIGQRDAFWKDVCRDDPKALDPRKSGFDPAARTPEAVVERPVCGFPDLKFPADFAVFAAGAYEGRKIGFQIDQSGSEATQFDVSVNSPGKPVALMLGAYEPTIWNVRWTDGTRILAVLVGGYHRQAVAGREKGTLLLNSSYDNKGPCGYFYVTPEKLAGLNPLSRRVFGRPVDMVYPAKKGIVVVGEPIPAGTRLPTSADITPESFQDKNAPLAGPAGQGVPKPPRPPLYNAYVVLSPFTYPAGLYGGNSATFLIPEGVPKPAGDPGHSLVFDFNTLKCEGVQCGAR